MTSLLLVMFVLMCYMFVIRSMHGDWNEEKSICHAIVILWNNGPSGHVFPK